MIDWLTKMWKRRSKGSGAQAHLTFGQTSVGRTLSRTGLLLKKHLWIWPIIAVILLAIIGYGVRMAIESTIRDGLISELSTLRDVEKAMLKRWLALQENSAESLANDQQIRESISQILRTTSDDAETPIPPTATSAALETVRATLARELSPGMAAHDFTDFIVADKKHRIVAASQHELLGNVLPRYDSFLSRSFDRQTTVSTPFASNAAVKDVYGRVRSDSPTMFAVAPVRDANFQVIAVLGFRLQPEKEFTRIL